MGIVHGNLGPHSVIINTFGDVVLHKFRSSTSSSKRVTDAATITAVRRLYTLPYTAPEIVLDEACDSSGRQRSRTCRSDVYTFGMLVYEILSGRVPWDDMRPIDVLRCMISGQHLTRPEDDTLDDSMWSLCMACWATDPKERPPISSILAGLRSGISPIRWGADSGLGRDAIYHWQQARRVESVYRRTWRSWGATGTSLPGRAIRIEINGVAVDIALPNEPSFAGGFGDVMKGYGELDGINKVFAVKICRGDKILPRELEIWRTLSHENILPLCGAIELGDPSSPDSRECIFVSPYLRRGNLVHHLKSDPHTPRLPLMIDVALGLAYLHNVKRIIHGDIKAENVLISDNGRAVLADFGLSTYVSPRRQGTSDDLRRLYTWAYCAPEVLDDTAEDPSAPGVIRSKTKMSDMFAYGVLLYQTYAGELGQSQRARIKLMLDMYDGRYPPRPLCGETVLCDNLWSICTQCWEKNPTQRPPIATVLAGLDDLQLSQTGVSSRARDSSRERDSSEKSGSSPEQESSSGWETCSDTESSSDREEIGGVGP